MIEGTTPAALDGPENGPGVREGVIIVRRRAGAPKQAMQFTGANRAEVEAWIRETGETPFKSHDDGWLLIGRPADYIGGEPGTWFIRDPQDQMGYGHDLKDPDEFTADYEPAADARLMGQRDAAMAEAARLRTELEHARSALAGDNEGVRLWMLDCAAVQDRLRASLESVAAHLPAILDALRITAETHGGDAVRYEAAREALDGVWPF